MPVKVPRQLIGKTSEQVITANFTGFNKRPKGVIVLSERDVDPILFKILSVAVPHGHEKDIAALLPQGHHRKTDKKGNVFFFIGNAKKHHTMFSCHMDTVHKKPGVLNPVYCPDGFIWGGSDLRENTSKNKTRDSAYHYTPDIVGADDKVGVYIMLKLMEHKVPGLYAFHVGEEVGCVGSKYAAENSKEMFKSINRCIAFDRRGYNNVITKQRGDICCSDEFAIALSEQLNNNLNTPHVRFKPDPTGVYTDSASYTEIIPECTNLSVGYFCSHGPLEHFDLIWLEHSLLPALLKVRWDLLPTKRKAEPKPVWSGYSHHNTNNTPTTTWFETSNLGVYTPYNRIPPFSSYYIKKIAGDAFSSERAVTTKLQIAAAKSLAEDGGREICKSVQALLTDISKLEKDKSELEKLIEDYKKDDYTTPAALEKDELMHGWSEELYVNEIKNQRKNLAVLRDEKLELARQLMESQDTIAILKGTM